MAFKARLNFTGKEHKVLYHSYSPDPGSYYLNVGIPLRLYNRKPMLSYLQDFNDWPKA